MAELVDLVSQFHHITIVCHRNADPDTIGCAYALRSALKQKSRSKSVTILALDGIGAVSNKLVKYLKLSFATSAPKQTDIFVLVDLPSLDVASEIKDRIEKERIPYVVLDHHTPDPKTVNNSKLSIVKTRSSACEIMYEALEGKGLQKKGLNALLAGIVYDSRRFLLLPNSAIITASEMIKMGADYQAVLEMLFNEQEQPEKIAKLKGASRMRLKKAGEYLVAFSYVGSYEASVAKALTDLGADMALVVNDEGASIRLTGRATDKFSKATTLNLAKDIMQPLANAYAGQGGGHPTAASVNLVATPEEAFSMASDLIAEKLGIAKNSIKEINTKK